MTAPTTSPIRPTDQARGLHWLARCREALREGRTIPAHTPGRSTTGGTR